MRSQSIAGAGQSTVGEPYPEIVGMLAGILLLFLINVVAIAAFLATAAQAVAAGSADRGALALVALGEISAPSASDDPFVLNPAASIIRGRLPLAS
jgi:hypothetical protein